MTKIFSIGLHRVGSQSVNHLFELVGLKAIHWPSVVNDVNYEESIRDHEGNISDVIKALIPVLNDYDALSDVPICAIYNELPQHFPEARYVALTRSPGKWVASVRRHIGIRPLDPYEKCLYWRYISGRPNTLSDISDDDLMYMFFKHYQDVCEFGRQNALLCVDIEDELAGEKISAFIGAPLTKLPRIDYLALIAPTDEVYLDEAENTFIP